MRDKRLLVSATLEIKAMSVGRWRPQGDPRPKPQGHLTGPHHRLHLHALFFSLPSHEFASSVMQVFAFLRGPEVPKHPQVICPWAWPPPHQTLTSPRRQPYQVWTESSPSSGRAQDPPCTPAEEGQASLGLSMAVTCQIWSDHRPGGAARAAIWPRIREEARGLRKC